MFYEYRLTVPANTPASAPLTLAVKLSPGRIIAMAVQIPLGCRGFVNAQIWQSLEVQWPSNPDSSISGDGVVVEWQESFDLDPTAPNLVLAAWNLDDSYAHTVTFRINVLAQSVIEQQNAALAALGYLAKWYAQQPPT
jgi:hypothetical protein